MKDVIKNPILRGFHPDPSIIRVEDDYYIARTEWDSPEVDPEVLVKKTLQLVPGDFVDVIVTEALPFELIAIPADASHID